MERKGWVLGGLALVAIALVVGLSWSAADPEVEDAHIDAASAAGTPVTGGADQRGSTSGAIAHAGRGRAFEGDAGLRGRTSAPSPAAPEPTQPANARGELRRGDLGADESAGWRLGQTRGRIALVEPRIARMQQLASELEERGDTEAAERQRVVLRRFETRLEELRAEETELAAEAQREGTLDEVEVGMREGVSPNQRERPAVQLNPR